MVATRPLRTAVLAALSLGLLAALPASASAHAILEASKPASGAELSSSPSNLSLRFSEAVTIESDALRLFDGTGSAIELSPTEHGATDNSVTAAVPEQLRRGAYTATYAVISADGHPISGGFTFYIGKTSVLPSKGVDELTRFPDQGAAEALRVGAKFAIYLATAMLAGGFLVLIFVLFPSILRLSRGDDATRAAAKLRQRVRTLGLIGGALALVGTLVGLAAQAALANRIPPLDALIDQSKFGPVFGSEFGLLWFARGWALLILAAILVTLRQSAGVKPKQPRRWIVAAGLLASIAAFLVPALTGHARAAPPVVLTVLLDALHAATAGFWIGGIIVLLVALPAATSASAIEPRTQLLAGALLRFSPLALGSVAVLVVTGTVQGLLIGGPISTFLDSDWGKLLAIKVGVLLLALASAAWLRQRLLPQLKMAAQRGQSPGKSGRAIRSALRLEIGLLVIVLLVTAVLTGQSPSGEPNNGPFDARQRAGDATLQLTVDPARSGPNSIHIYATNATTGVPIKRIPEVSAALRLDNPQIGPLAVDLRRAGPGHYVGNGVQISPGGNWKLSVYLRRSTFDATTTTFDVPVK